MSEYKIRDDKKNKSIIVLDSDGLPIFETHSMQAAFKFIEKQHRKQEKAIKGKRFSL